jgi:SAM-dependent methyltransferase
MDTVIHAGMNQETNFFDFGCGTGRLAAQAVPFLNSDKYAGSDISKTMLSQADSLVKGFGKNARFFHQVTYKFPEQKLPIDMFSAFSVFTHMEHEDTYRYLCEAHRIASRNAIFVASILPISTALGESVFLSDSSVDFKDRWKNVRNVSTSLDFFQKIAELSGWKILEILNGDENSIPSRFGGESSCLGQTVVVMQR